MDLRRHVRRRQAARSQGFQILSAAFQQRGKFCCYRRRAVPVPVAFDADQPEPGQVRLRVRDQVGQVAPVPYAREGQGIEGQGAPQSGGRHAGFG